ERVDRGDRADEWSADCEGRREEVGHHARPGDRAAQWLRGGASVRPVDGGRLRLDDMVVPQDEAARKEVVHDRQVAAAAVQEGEPWWRQMTPSSHARLAPSAAYRLSRGPGSIEAIESRAAAG